MRHLFTYLPTVALVALVAATAAAFSEAFSNHALADEPGDTDYPLDGHALDSHVSTAGQNPIARRPKTRPVGGSLRHGARERPHPIVAAVADHGQPVELSSRAAKNMADFPRQYILRPRPIGGNHRRCRIAAYLGTRPSSVNRHGVAPDRNATGENVTELNRLKSLCSAPRIRDFLDAGYFLLACAFL